MGLNILDFKSKLVGGGSRPNLFQVDLDFPVGLDKLGENRTQIANSAALKDTARFLIKSAQIPSLDIGVIPIPFRGREIKVAGDRTFEPWTVSVINDADYILRSAFESWSRGINALTENTSQLGFTTETNKGKCTSYLVDIVVSQLSRECVTPSRTPTNINAVGVNNETVTRKYKLYGAWVSSVSPIDLSYEANNMISEYSVTFQYQYFEVLK